MAGVLCSALSGGPALGSEPQQRTCAIDVNEQGAPRGTTCQRRAPVAAPVGRDAGRARIRRIGLDLFYEPRSLAPYRTPPDAEMIYALDLLAKRALEEEPVPGPDGRRERAVEVLTAGGFSESRIGEPGLVPQAAGSAVRALGHIHTLVPGRSGINKRNRFPSITDQLNAARDPLFRFYYTRGTDGRIVRQRARIQDGRDFISRLLGGTLETVTIRGPTVVRP